MEELLIVVESLVQSDVNQIKELQKEFYKKFCKFKSTEICEVTYLKQFLLPKIEELCEKHVIKKDIIYLNLLAYNNVDLLKILIEYDQSNYELNITNYSSLYDYSIFKNQHWFYSVIENYIREKNSFSEAVFQKILILRLIQITSLSKIPFKDVKDILETLNKTNMDVFCEQYITYIQHFLNTVDFCKEALPNIDANEVFYFACDHYVLEVFSKFLDITKVEWIKILDKIYDEQKLQGNIGDTQSQHFQAFYVLGNIFHLILPDLNHSNSVNEILEDIKMKILSLKDKLFQIRLLENIFAILFIKTSNLLSDDHSKQNFICKEKQIRLILYSLKVILDDIKLKKVYSKKTEEYSRFNNLNKFVTDAIWRVELIEAVKSTEKCEANLLKYLLSPPESLIRMCVKRHDFKRAYQVIEIFGLQNNYMFYEIKHLEKFGILKDELKTSFKVWDIQKSNQNLSCSGVEQNVKQIIHNFLKKDLFPYNPEMESAIVDLSKETPFFNHFRMENGLFMNIFDLAICQTNYFEYSANIMHLAFEDESFNPNIHSYYQEFTSKIYELWQGLGFNQNLTPSDIILSPYLHLDLHKCKKEEVYDMNLAEIYDEFNNILNTDENGVLNSNHPSHKALLKLNSLCSEFVQWNYGNVDSVKYLAKLYNYLKAFSKVLYIEQDSSDIISQGKNTSYFTMLYFNRSELMGKLLFERHLDPSEFEKYFSKLKLDYLYHVIGNCFPTINLHSQENVTKEELYPENSLYVPSKGIITYIQKRNWLLAFILNEMYKVDDVKMDISEGRVKSFLNYMKLPKVQHLKALFENNEIVTALQNEISPQKVSRYINMNILKNEYLASSHYSVNSNDSFEAAEELLEDAIKTTNWKELYDIIDSIPENQLSKSLVLLELKDLILVNLVQDRFEINYFKYVQYISDNDLRLSTILQHLKEWPGEFCIDLIKSEMSKFETIQNVKINELNHWLQQIELCEEIKDILKTSSWSKACEICVKEPTEVITKLLFFSNKINLLLDFIDIYKPDQELLSVVHEDYFITIFEIDNSYESIRKLLDNLPYNHAINICYNLLKHLKKLGSLQFVVEYLLNNVNNDLLKNVQISLKMLSIFPEPEQQQLLCLIYEPLNIIEILIMNTKLDKLSAILEIVRSELNTTECYENHLSTEKIDEALRNYAEKSLDFRVITQPNPRLLRSPESKLMQSIDSLTICTENRGFVMPEEVPSKDEWVANNEVLECMCCQKITFSMFNRRHHCRRCGRVVCYNCSPHRMIVPTYEDILVRVCKDCHHQTMGEGTTLEFTDTVSTKSLIYDFWLLTDDEEHNKVVREEFSYEHAPSVSLCLSIMKYHSKNVQYPKFLLEQCEIMLKLLQPSQEPFQEIDYLLVIKMLKSLAIAAKVISVDCALQYGTSTADRILSQAELLGLLAERGCLGLLPVSSTHRGPFIDASVLRKLRDKLLEREQWNLALEVSTKAGLDVAGIFAAWGKSCLKAGSLMVAREKFQRCFDKTSHYENISDTNSQSELDMSQDSLNRSRNISKASSLGMILETKPLKNPPLLNEIIYILEMNTMSINPDVVKQVENQTITGSNLLQNQPISMDSAVCIINKLKNLKNIANGNYSQQFDVNKSKSKTNRNVPLLDSIFYNECIYYLTRYGTHSTLLEFYIKHGDISKALNYIVDCQLSGDVFIDIYMRCLKDGVVNVLQEHMLRIDSTLGLFKEYLQSICRHLEKHSMLHSLYQLQQFMGDFIRAAMTCIRFYQEHAKCFLDLLNNSNYLQKAEEHLREELVQDQWVEVASVRQENAESESGYEEKSLTNPSLVMKMSAKDINKNIDTIWRQKEVVTFLASCESCDVKPIDILRSILHIEESASQGMEIVKIPTLFGSAHEKLQLAVLAIVCGKNVDDGFHLAFSIIQEFKLKPVKVYCEAGKQLAKAERYNGIAQLVGCIKNSGTKDTAITDMCDEMLTLAVATFAKANVSGTKVEDLIKLISDRATKISAYIEAKQLKTAYFLAVKYKRMSDIRRILREAELLNQPSIKALCQKVLLAHSHASNH